MNGVRLLENADYPLDTWSYSPSEPYPEYGFQNIASAPNPIYSSVRSLLYDCGLDLANYDTPGWNPLGKWIKPGGSVFILCNFVQERRGLQSERELLSKCSHGSVLRAVCDYVLIALKLSLIHI